MTVDRRTLEEFFREHIQLAQQRHNMTLRDVTEFYIVNLLTEFSDTRRLFADDNDELTDEALASIYSRAVEAISQAEQFRLLKLIGDRSLYVSGFFPDSFRRKIFDIDYYVAMGERAYANVSSLATQEHQRGVVLSGVFGELAEKFSALVDLLSEISERSGMTSDRDLLRLYERWLATKSKRLSERLREEGIIPVDTERGHLH